jgi:hypothetical protein
MFESPYKDWPFAFLHPEDWSIREIINENSIEIFIAGPRNRANTFTTSMTVRGHVGRGQTLEKLTAEHINRYRPLAGFKVIAQTRGVLDGDVAVEVEIAYVMPLPLNNVNAQMTPIRERRIFLKQEERIYELIYAATEEDYQTYLPSFKALVHTFEPAAEIQAETFQPLLTSVEER